MNRIGIVVLSALFVMAAITLTPLPVEAQKAGQSAKISVGVVTQTERVDMQSDAAKSAVVGGVIGYHTTSSKKSSSRKWRNAAIGAAALGATRRAGEGNLTGTLYTVQLIDGSTMKIVSDQNEIKKGDCVTVEQVKDNANVRRVDPVMCEPESKDVVQEVAPELQEEADECYDAKQELLNAGDDAAVERAARKVQILCNN